MGLRSRMRQMLKRQADAPRSAPPRPVSAPRGSRSARLRDQLDQEESSAEAALSEPSVAATQPPEPDRPSPVAASSEASPEEKSPVPMPPPDPPSPPPAATPLALAAEPGEAWLIRAQSPEDGSWIEFPCREDESLCDAADRAGLEIPSSCRSGGCLVCAVRVLEGEVEMSPDQYVLEPEDIERGFRLACCSQPRAGVSLLLDQHEIPYED